MDQNVDKDNVKNADQLRKSMEGASDATSRMQETLSTFKETSKQVANIWLKFDAISKLEDVIQTMVKTNSELHRAGVNAGMSSAQIAKLKDSVSGLQKELGATQTEAVNIFKTLSKTQFQGNMQKAAEATFLFHKATDMSEEAVAQLTTELSKGGQMGEKGIMGVYGSMLQVQQSIGLSTEGMETLSKSIGKTSANMKAFGKTDADIVRMTKDTAKLVAEMEKVGISASESTAFVEKLLDPSRIQENIKMYAALGISINDAMNGDITDQLDDKLKEFGQKLQGMSKVAGSAYAQAFGIDYNMAIKAAQADTSENTEAVEETGKTAEEILQELSDRTMDITEKAQAAINKIAGTIQSLGPVVLSIILIAGKVIGRKLKNAFNKKINEGFETVGKKINETSKKAKSNVDKNFLNPMEARLNRISEGFSEDMGKDAIAARKEIEKIYSKRVEEQNKIEAMTEEISRLKIENLITPEEFEKMKQKISDFSAWSAEEFENSLTQVTIDPLKGKEAIKVLAEVDPLQANQLKKIPGEIGNKIKASGIEVAKESTEKICGDIDQTMSKNIDNQGGILDSFLSGFREAGGKSIKENLKNAALHPIDTLKGVFKQAKTALLGIIVAYFRKMRAQMKEKRQKRAETRAARGGGKADSGIKKVLSGFLKGAVNAAGKALRVVLSSAIAATGIGIAIVAIGAILSAAFVMIKNAIQNNEGMQKLIEDFKTKIEALKKVAAQVLEPIMDQLAPIIEELFGSIELIIGVLMDSIKPIIEMIFNLLKPIISIVSKLMTILAPIIQLLSVLVTVILFPIMGILTLLMKLINLILFPFQQLAKFICRGKQEETDEKLQQELAKNTEATEENSDKQDKKKGEIISIGGGGKAITSGLDQAEEKQTSSSTIEKTNGTTTSSSVSSESTETKSTAVTSNDVKKTSEDLVAAQKASDEKLEKLVKGLEVEMAAAITAQTVALGAAMMASRSPVGTVISGVTSASAAIINLFRSKK